MKAKDLIKILEKNPEMEVKLYNGFVDDWMDISIDEHELVKEKPSVRLDMINYQNEQNGHKKLESTKSIKTEWEFKNNFIDYESEHYKKCFTYKNIFLIQGKRRNKTTYDRLGSIYY